MADVPPISVVMPVYNSAGVVGEAVESILHQTLRDFEFIIVDDGSSDATPQILSEYAGGDSRIKLYTQENCGLIATLNRYSRIAVGKYIARMDADDISFPTRLKKKFVFWKSLPKSGVLGLGIQVVDKNRAQIIGGRAPADP